MRRGKRKAIACYPKLNLSAREPTFHMQASISEINLHIPAPGARRAWKYTYLADLKQKEEIYVN